MITLFVSSPNVMQESIKNQGPIFFHTAFLKMLQRLFFHHIETSQLICKINQLTGSYLM